LSLASTAAAVALLPLAAVVRREIAAHPHHAVTPQTVKLQLAAIIVPSGVITALIVTVAVVTVGQMKLVDSYILL
jgi:hypothetical protein